MNEVVEGGNKKDWINTFQELYKFIRVLNSKCTNMDFKSAPSVEDQVTGLTGGFENKCALCVVITRIVENYIIYHRKNVTDFLENEFCTLFDGVTKPTCQAFVHYAGPYIIKAILNKENADVACLSIGWCVNK